MKYRIEYSEEGYEPLIGKQRVSGGIYWCDLLNDNLNCNSASRFYETLEEAEEACHRHHVNKGYDKLPKVVKEFEL